MRNVTSTKCVVEWNNVIPCIKTLQDMASTLQVIQAGGVMVGQGTEQQCQTPGVSSSHFQLVGP